MTEVPTKPASSVLLIRDGASGLEVLMMKRAPTMAFAPGALVFPGGKLDASDRRRSFWRGHVTSKRLGGDLPLRVAALRELWEEVGALVATDVRGTVTSGQTVESIVKRGARLDTARLLPFAHWVTPEGLPKRYDTYFYLVADRRSRRVSADMNEALSATWVNPQQVLADWDRGTVPLMFPTRLNLMKLARAQSVAEAIHQTRVTPIVRTLPVISGGGTSRTVTISAAAGFGVTRATPRELAVEVPVRPKTG